MHDQTQLITSIVDLLLDAVCVVDRDGRYVFVSAAFEHIFGYTRAEIVGQPMIDLVLPDDREKTLREASEIMSGVPKRGFRNRYVRKDGRVVHIMWSARSTADGTRVAVARDVTELVQNEARNAALYALSEAAHTAADLPALFQRIHEIILELVPASTFVVAMRDDEHTPPTFPYVFEGRHEVPGSSRLEIERRCAEIILAEHSLQNQPDGAPLPPVAARTIRSEGPEWLGVPLRSRTGVLGALLLRSGSTEQRYTESDRELLQFVSALVATAIERKQSEVRLRHMALYDALTKLPNRDLLRDRLSTARVRAKRNGGRVALLFIDLDGFKGVNDSFGHAVGDLLLQEAAQRLRQSVRESDTVGRLGGDEFMVVLDAVGTPENALLVASRICTALARSFELGCEPVLISSSIGIALYPDHGSEDESLVRCADRAMYDAKEQGKNQVRMGTSASARRLETPQSAAAPETLSPNPRDSP